jgi:radical SAM superfamily enzyme YgiQ (UPF0313 family)
MPNKIGRNDPCPCGSGKKYKQCCGRPQQPAQVVYIHPAKQGVDFDARGGAPGSQPGRPYGLIPVGVPALVNVLRQNGIRVVGLNYPLEKGVARGFDLRQWLQWRPSTRIVLIDLHWYEHSYGAISVAQACKEVLPKAWTVLGGLTASGFAREILERYRAVDYVIRGDAEQPLLELVQRLLGTRARGAEAPDLTSVPNLSYRVADTVGAAVVENERSYCASTEDLDRLNFVDINFLEHHERYYTHEYIVTDLPVARQALEDGHPFRGRWLCSARGCKYNCSYCGGCKSAHEALAGRKGIVARSPSAMLEDLERLYEQGVHQASFSYDIYELGEAYWRELLEGLTQRGPRIGLYNELFQLPTPAFVHAFARCADMRHSSLAVSPLSGSEEVRRRNGKYFTNQELFELLTVLNLYNVPLLVYFSLNLPGEDEATMRESIELAERLYSFYPSSLLKILTSCHTIDPLAPMNVDPQGYDVTVDMRTFEDYYNYCRDTQLAGPESRTELHRGFRPDGTWSRSLAAMADMWDQARVGRESSWWPVPPGW